MLSRCRASHRWIRRFRHSTAVLPPRRIGVRWKSGLLPPMLDAEKLSSERQSLVPPSDVVPKEPPPAPEGTVAQTLVQKEKHVVFDPYKSNPRVLINNFYQSHHPTRLVTKSDYSITETIQDGRKWFAATFTCPVTGFQVDGGTLRGGTRFVEETEPKVVDGRNYYESKYLAIESASGRMMDAIHLCVTGKTEPRHCKEDPIDLRNEELSNTDKTKRTNIPRNPPKHTLHNLYKKIGIFDGDLHYWKCFETVRIIDEFNQSQTTAKFTCPVTGAVAHSGTMREPMGESTVIAGQVYYSKPRQTKHAEHAAAARFLDNLHYTETGEFENRYCKEMPSLIEEEGIEKLFISKRMKESGGDLEKIHVSVIPHEAQDTETDVTTSPSTDMVGAQLTQEYEALETENLDDVSLVMTRSANFDFAAAKDTAGVFKPEEDHIPIHSQTEDGEEEFMIQNLSDLKNSGRSTLERVMEAWGESIAAPQSHSEVSSAKWNGVPLYTSPSQQRQNVIDDAIAWHERMKAQEKDKKGYKVFQTSMWPLTVQSASTALKTLARATRSLPLDDQEANDKLESTARQMMDIVLTTEAMDVKVYNSYLQCLHRSSPTETAEAAQEILTSMIERREVDGRLLPEPNIDTYNTVIQLWASVGGDVGLVKCKEFFDVIQEEKDKGSDVEPNRSTFMSILSSMARPSLEEHITVFDREQAQMWIERMRTLRDEKNDDTLIPDTQVFNAPLRWSGGMESLRSRPYVQPIAWDKYAVVFQNGFQPLEENNPLRTEARRVEEWLLEMETVGPDPDIETFEAAIQEWARTGMADGLRRAELVALRAIASDKVSPRVQTFHPIIAGWALSGDERGPEKVREWIERLEEGGVTNFAMKPDTRIYTSLFIAKRWLQKRLLDSIESSTGTADEENDVTTPVDALTGEQDDSVVPEENAATLDKRSNAIVTATELATSCTDDLKRMFDDFLPEYHESKENEGFIMEPATFSHALCAWGDIAAVKTKALHPGDNVVEVVKPELRAMQQILRQFDTAVERLRSRQATQRERSNQIRFDEPLKQFLHHAQTVYLNALTYINQLDRQRWKTSQCQDASEVESLVFYEYLYEAESLFRRAEELRNVLYLYSSKNDDNVSPENARLVYDDLFTYSSEVSDAHSDKSYVEKQIALYSEIVEGCQRIQSSSACFSESVRLCMTIVDFLEMFPVPSASRTVDCTDLFLGILSVAEKIPSSFERYEALRRIFYCVRSISDAAKQDGETLTVDMHAIMKQMKGGEGTSAANMANESITRKKANRGRRIVKRQRWRTAGSRSHK